MMAAHIIKLGVMFGLVHTVYCNWFMLTIISCVPHNSFECHEYWMLDLDETRSLFIMVVNVLIQLDRDRIYEKLGKKTL